MLEFMVGAIVQGVITAFCIQVVKVIFAPRKK